MHTAAPAVQIAQARHCQLAAVQADARPLCLHIAGGELLVLQPLVERCHDQPPHPHARVLREAGDLPVVLVAHPDHRGVVGGVASEPPGVVVVGGAGLAGHRHAGDLSPAAGATPHGVSEQLVHIIGGPFFEHRAGVVLQSIIQQHLAIAVHHLSVGGGRGIDAATGESGIGRRHLEGGHAVGQAAHGQGGLVDIGEPLLLSVAAHHGAPLLQRGEAEALGEELEGGLRSHQPQGAQGDGVPGLGDTLAHCHQAQVVVLVVVGPGAAVQVHRVVVQHRGRGDEPHFNGGGIHRQGLEGGAGLEGGRGIIEDTVLRLLPYISGDGHHGPRFIVHHGDGRLDGISVAGHLVVQIAPVLIGRVHRRLGVRVIVAVDGQAAAVDHLHHGPAVHACRLYQVVPDLGDHRLHIPGVDVGGVHHAVAVLVVAAVHELQLFGHRRIALRLSDIAPAVLTICIQHLCQDGLLPGLIVVPGRPHHPFTQGAHFTAVRAGIGLGIGPGLTAGALIPGDLH